MKKLFYTLGITLSLIASAARADVRFVVGKGESFSGERQKDHFYDFEVKKLSACEEEGYNQTSCPEGYTRTNPCPYNSNYFQTCCPQAFRYTKEQCEAMDMHPSQQSCGGKHACE